MKKPTKKQVEKVEHTLKTAKILRGSKSQRSVARFIVKELGKNAVKFATGLEAAATEKGLKRRLGKLKAVVASESESAAA
jgi:hypothetical protein